MQPVPRDHNCSAAVRWCPKYFARRHFSLSSTGSGLELQANGTSTFNFGSLTVTTDAGPGLFALNSGTINIAGTGNSIAATGGAALDLTATSLGSGATFATV